MGIDQAPGLQKDQGDTRSGLRRGSLMIGIPAHDEESTIVAAVTSARRALEALGCAGRVVVAASGCRDRTAEHAAAAGAQVLIAGAGKGRAVDALVAELREEVMALVDADVVYHGSPPLAELVARPVLDATADACVADLFWRPIYPQMWSLGFWAPLVGSLLPEVAASLGRGSWSGQRAAVRELWTGPLPAGFDVEAALNVRWGLSGRRCVAVPSADWVQPVRPKDPFFADELRHVLDAAEDRGRLRAPRAAYLAWLDGVQAFMATYRHDETDVARFERELADHAQRTLP